MSGSRISWSAFFKGCPYPGLVACASASRLRVRAYAPRATPAAGYLRLPAGGPGSILASRVLSSVAVARTLLDTQKLAFESHNPTCLSLVVRACVRYREERRLPTTQLPPATLINTRYDGNEQPHHDDDDEEKQREENHAPGLPRVRGPAARDARGPGGGHAAGPVHPAGRGSPQDSQGLRRPVHHLRDRGRYGELRQRQGSSAARWNAPAGQRSQAPGRRPRVSSFR